MKKVNEAMDVNNHALRRGDIVTPIRENVKAKIYDIREEFGTSFVQLRPVHLPYARAVWHCADHVQWLPGGANANEPSAGN
jgi:hypothetical protein